RVDVEAQVAEHGDLHRREPDGVAVRLLVTDVLHRRRAGGARPVLDDDRLAEDGLELRGERPGGEVRAAAGGGLDDERDVVAREAGVVAAAVAGAGGQRQTGDGQGGDGGGESPVHRRCLLHWGRTQGRGSAGCGGQVA